MDITLQQDAGNKLTVKLNETVLLAIVRKYFKWKKDVTASRLNKLGTSDRDKFIQFLYDCGFKK